MKELESTDELELKDLTPGEDRESKGLKSAGDLVLEGLEHPLDPSAPSQSAADLITSRASAQPNLRLRHALAGHRYITRYQNDIA